MSKAPYGNNKNACTGCEACSNICPVNAIKMLPDNEGFLYPEIDYAKCTNCGLCFKICPANSSDVIERGLSNPLVYAAWNKNDIIRNQSSSGGIFSLLAEKTIETNGAVFGASFDQDMVVNHILVKNKEDLQKLRGSKYVQSRIGNSYSVAKDLLNKDVHVLFSGTPCQIMGLYAFLQEKPDTLYTCDLICHGVPSPKVLADYLKELEKEYGAKATKISFRDKSSGWSRPTFVVEFSNGQKYKEFFYEKDAYGKGFGLNLFLRPSCYICKYSNIPRVSDITLGDFWGIEKHMPNLDYNKGISIVLLNTEKGVKLFDSIKNELDARKCTLEMTDSPHLQHLRTPPKPPKGRKRFFQKYRSSKHLTKLISKSLKTSPITRLKSIAKRFLNRINNEKF